MNDEETAKARYMSTHVGRHDSLVTRRALIKHHLIVALRLSRCSRIR